MADPRTRKFCENGDTFQGWIGPDVHFLFSTIKNGSDCCWVMTHKDDANIEESWSLPGKLEDVYKVIDGWDPMCRAIVEKTPAVGKDAKTSSTIFALTVPSGLETRVPRSSSALDLGSWKDSTAW